MQHATQPQLTHAGRVSRTRQNDAQPNQGLIGGDSSSDDDEMDLVQQPRSLGNAEFLQLSASNPGTASPDVLEERIQAVQQLGPDHIVNQALTTPYRGPVAVGRGELVFGYNISGNFDFGNVIRNRLPQRTWGQALSAAMDYLSERCCTNPCNRPSNEAERLTNELRRTIRDQIRENSFLQQRITDAAEDMTNDYPLSTLEPDTQLNQQAVLRVLRTANLATLDQLRELVAAWSTQFPGEALPEW